MSTGANANALKETARLYGALEDHLRWAAKENKPRTIVEICEHFDFNNFGFKSPQVSKIIHVLAAKSFVTASRRLGTPNAGGCYVWNLDAPPFLFAEKASRKAERAPSAPIVTNVSNPVATQLAKIAQEVEIAMGGVTVIVGRNPKTGRIRITIDEV